MAKTNVVDYKNFAIKYRPEKFEDVVGQDTITKTIQNSLKLGRIPHAYFLYGLRGCGKTTVARIFAKALNCTGNKNTKPTPSPCGKCPQCVEIAQGSDIDVMEIDAASNTQVDKVREVIIDTVSLAPSRNRYKVFILDEVHMLSAGSFNALLKTIEEPPAHVVFVLATTERHKVPATIISRCQSFRFRPISDKDTTAHLEKISKLEKLDIETNAIKAIARSSGGALRDAITLLDRTISYAQGKISSETVGQMLGSMPFEIIEDGICAIADKDTQKLHLVFEKMNTEGYDVQSFLKDLRFYFTDLFYYALKLGDTPFKNAEEIIKKITPGQIAVIVRKLAKIAGEIRFSDMPQVLAEMALFTFIESEFDLESFVNRLENLENNLPDENTSAPENTTDNVKKNVSKISNKPKKIQEIPSNDIKPTVGGSKQISDKVVWKNLLDRLSSEKPILHQVLSTSSFRPESENVWVITVFDEFAKSTIENQKNKILDIVSSISGRKINFNLNISSAPTQPVTEEMPQENNTAEFISDEKSLTDNPNWQNENLNEETNSSVKNVLKHIEGEIIR